MFSPLTVVSPPAIIVPAALEFTIWPYQHRFQQAAQVMADGIFDDLDQDLRPEVMLLGIPNDGGPAVCLEPEQCGLPSEAFAEVMTRGQYLRRAKEATMPLVEGYTTEMMTRRFEGMGLRLAVQEVLDELEKKSSALRSFAGWPVLIGEFFVVTILRVRRKFLKAHPALQPNRFYTDGRPLASSLIEAAVRRFHEECIKSLTEPDPGSGLLLRPRDTDEVVRSAGKLLMDTPAQALGMDPAAAKLFNTLNTVSSLRYEGTAGVGQVLLARRGHPNVQEIFALTCPTPLSDYRAVRKLLQMTSNDVSLLSDGENVYALGRQVGNYDSSREDLFVISFLHHYVWEFRHGGQVIMRSSYGQPSLPQTRLSRSEFRQGLRQTFGLTDPAKVERLWDVLVEASRQQSGTLVVITTEALAEADRLKLQCTLIEPVPLTPLITRLVTAIDGAVLIDPEAYCYSIGVILDGKASGRGSSTRGARYNSALRYVESSPYPCMAIVVSEDGLVDILTQDNLPERH
ncbi:DNA integrity scanning protein DisA nucleotide-binding domain protein [Hymenobacter latericus]|uniref:DNA integrity scanning protein DisA nucleotide-binding domain protein n=1 Tax=Hymenobacter sp. YIM 151858-1 TaxID=2987688 RepID=UPI002225EA89|nr:DNA integrity scanning protein DisA nucleotide-binding domain protein [Hymenobacter sp. YIM 151858-1]UYZ58961.1 DNA integrity scanning protein DisA nucleotide-binding domain protein [Hymenobacter sp. YIM 151858-1]